MTDEELAAYYPTDYWGAEDQPSVQWIRSSQAEKVTFLRACGLRSGRILDVGCGAGFFLRALDPASFDRYGVEISPQAAKSAERSLGPGGVFTGTLIDAGFSESTFDVVTLWSTLEHTDQPRANLIEVRRILKPGGTLIVQMPNIASLQARLFRGKWFALDAPRHRYHFSPDTLAALLAATGFKPYQTTFFSKAHNAHAFRQSLKAVLFGTRVKLAGRTAFLLSLPFIKPVDLAMSALRRGATLTVAAYAD
jgi:2-polyprenyl-3-methyl-5-hydroxy-6-metoxy-1,4-benzoquinol methylase